MDQTTLFVGIGTTSPSTKLHIVQTSALSTRESLMKLAVSDAGNDAFYIANGTSTDNTFWPAFAGYGESTTRSGIQFLGLLPASADSSDSSDRGILNFEALRTTSATDPLNGTFSGIVNRKLFTFSDINGAFINIYPSRNISIGAAFVPSARLHVRGSGSTSATTSFRAENLSGSASMVVLDNGNVGIGITAPLTKLVVSGSDDAAATGVIEIQTTGGTNLKLGGNTTYSWIQTHGSKPLYINSLGNNVIFNNGGGNVGIGTTNPAYKLDVNGVANFSNGFSAPSSETGYRLKFNDNGGINNDTGIGLDGTTGAEQMWFNALGGFYWGLGTGGTKMYLNSSGNLGIGTTSPSQKLHVAGDALITGSLTVNGTITAKEFKTEFVSASITYASGSHKFGDTLDDTHQVTGSMTITGSLGLKGILYDNLGTAGTPDQILFTTSTGVEWRDNVANSAQNLIITGKNVGGTTIPKGSPVYFTDSGTSGNLVGILSADAGDPDLMPAGGVVAQALDPGGEGDVFIYGFINGVDTSAFTSGDDVFVAVGGGYTNVKPTGSALIQKLGNVEKSNPTNGSGVIQGPSWYNDLPNWEEGRVMVGRSAGQPVTSSVVYLDESNGYMGIGTSLPFTEFHVEGTATVNNTLSFNGIASIYQNSNSNLNINNPGWGFVGKGIDITAAGLLTLTATETYIPTGDVGIGESNPGVKLHVAGNISGSTIYASGDVIAYYSSDRRLKDNITPIKDPIAKLQQIGGYEFDWNENQDIYTGHDVGVVAQEIEAILPSLVTTTGTGYKGVKYEKLVALLIEGIKDQQKQIDELREEIKNLKK
jgi:hypothetical protein